MKDKQIHIKLGNGEEWVIDPSWVATKIADHYSSVDHGDEWEAEYKIAIADGDEMIDFLLNNFNWEDIKYAAKQLPRKVEEPDYEQLWLDAECKMTTK